ncbi:MAG: MetQ/NlpA family ABC transporter substrate-binding protein [Lachnospiraceae bacterium]|nr:MetQ/NlpA family ABC transporter substrate-binding protein [Lachnospiraceae bacterium]MBP5415149.1 MetQ/NlpA family ABC transporter substrate-binding protein [Lachnospiraceae bacterium]MBP5745985.1 MetQ/NlpA family ABC transporter substrate-binding protein [Lachnospiraceae bacterium]
MLTACGSNNTAQTENSSEVTAQNKEEETVVNIPADETPTADTAPSQEPVVVTIGTTSDDPRLWDALQAELDARGDNIKIEFKNIDGTILNQAVADGELDLNSFQHYAYFNQVKTDQNLDLTAIGETLIVPLDLFSNKYTSLDEIPDNGSIAVPDDATNQGRALNVLKNAGLISLDPAAGTSATIKDITENPKNLKIVELGGSQIPRSLDDVDAGVINCGYAVDAGLDINNPLYKDEIDLNNPEQQPYINIIVSKTSEAENPIYLEVVDAYRSARVYDATIERFNGAAIPAFDKE